MAFRVSQTARATRDLDAILEWLMAEEAGETGLRWFRKMKDAVASLGSFPERCGIAPESRDFPFEVRHLIFGRKPHLYRVRFYDRGRCRGGSSYPPWPPTETKRSPLKVKFDVLVPVGAVAEFGHGAGADDFAAVDDGQVVAETLYYFEDVRGADVSQTLRIFKPTLRSFG
jgi:plasmid stabilization system protein ParE